LKSNKRRPAKNNLEAAEMMANLASVCLQEGMREESEILYRRAAPVCERIWGANDRRFASVLWNYGGLLRATGRKVKGGKLQARSKEIMAEVKRKSLNGLSIDMSDLLSQSR
jgi:hypothetical protein